MNKLFKILSWSVLVPLTSALNAQVITFTGDPFGPIPNGFCSWASSCVTFEDSLGNDLYLQNFGNQSHGNALAAFADATSAIKLKFDHTVDFLTFEFGNDDPAFSNPGDFACLSLFLEGKLVGNQSVLMNRNDIMDQSITFGGALFDCAIFKYDVSTEGMMEIIDNVQFRLADAPPANIVPVPEPSTYGLLGASALTAVALLRRRRSSAR